MHDPPPGKDIRDNITQTPPNWDDRKNMATMKQNYEQLLSQQKEHALQAFQNLQLNM